MVYKLYQPCAFLTLTNVSNSFIPLIISRNFALTTASKYKMSLGGSTDKCPIHMDKLYEMRMYKCQPQHFAKFMALTKDNIGTRMSHSKMLGYWVTEFGTLNRVTHLWEYDSYAQRAQVRSALMKDSSWMNNYISAMKPLLKKEKNIALRRLSDDINFSFGSPEDQNTYYRLNVFVMKEANEKNIVKFKELMVKLFDKLAKDNITSMKHMGTFITDSTKMHEIIQYVKCTDLDDKTLFEKLRGDSDLTNLLSEMEKIAVLGNSQILKTADFRK